MNKKLLFVSFLLLLGAAACKKDNDKSTDGTPTLPSNEVYDDFSLKLDGTTINPAGTVTQHNSNMVIVQASQDNNLVGLMIIDTLDAGTYPIAEGGPFRLIHSDDNYATVYRSTAGSATIVSHSNNMIKGYYNCTLTRDNPAGTKTVTEGEFNIEY